MQDQTIYYRKTHNRTIIIAILAVVLVAVGIVVWMTAFRRGSRVSVSEGIAYIRSMEQVDTSAVEKDIFSMKKEKILNGIRERLDEDPDLVWTMLNEINTVILGDSRAVAFGTYGLIDENRVLAEGGKKIDEISSHYEELKAINPRLVVLHYGLNEIWWGYSTPEEFAEACCGYVDEIQSFLPDAYIYINSIMPPNEDGEAISEGYAVAREWSAAEIEYYKEHGYRYLDISYLADEHPEYYGEDGVHFYPGFYYYWGDEILLKYLEDSE